MFTGIITEIGMIASNSRSKIAVRASRAVLRKLDIGTSIAVDGTCLTVIAKEKNSFTTNSMPETRRRTTLGHLQKNDMVNLELPATPASLLSGHIVQGHIDTVGTLQKIRRDGTDRVLSIVIPRNLARYIVPQGSIAVNGISLTVSKTSSSRFEVSIIPHTWNTTTLCELASGDTVNIEVDVVAKYIEQLLKKQI